MKEVIIIRSKRDSSEDYALDMTDALRIIHSWGQTPSDVWIDTMSIQDARMLGYNVTTEDENRIIDKNSPQLHKEEIEEDRAFMMGRLHWLLNHKGYSLSAWQEAKRIAAKYHFDLQNININNVNELIK